MNRFFLVSVTAVGLAAGVVAQDPEPGAARYERFGAIQTADMTRLSTVMVQSRLTTGAPYSAEAVTESTQALPDGNRIATKTVTRLYRDGEGRTRREQIHAETGAVQTVSISDPVTGSTYTLDPVNRTATRNGIMVTAPSGFAGGGGARGGRGGGAIAARTPEPGGDAVTLPRQAAPVAVPAQPSVAGARGRGGAAVGETTREDLGLQTVEGVPATGTRSTTVIPAGAIGNLQPIKVVSEQWMSPDLKVLVLTKHSDPRTGETIYRLSNIVRAEPDRSLFVVPPDYTLKETNIRRQPQ